MSLDMMDSQDGSPFDWDGSSLVGEIDEDLAKTFCLRHEDSKLDVTIVPKSVTDGEAPDAEADSSTPISSVADLYTLASQPDLCQIFSIYQKNSYSRLSITYEIFESLLSAYSVFHCIWDFVLPFRVRLREVDVGSAPFKFQQIECAEIKNSKLASFECAYSFRYVVPNQRAKQLEGNPDYDPWSIRQTAVYQKYNDSHGKMTFILIAPSNLARDRLEAMITREKERERQLSAFGLHGVLISTFHENWSLYIRALEHSLRDQLDRVTLAQVQIEAQPLSPVPDLAINFLDRQRIKRIQEHILDLKIIFDSLLDTLSRMQRQCQRQCRGPLCENCKCSTTVEELEEQMDDTRLNTKKADVLHERVLGTAQILSNLLEFENAKSLNGLMKETREENGKMRILTERSTRDAAAVKILTIITLIYLPMTVVSNFFSTQLIRVDDSGTISVVKDSWWFAAVSIPLTVATFMVWKYWLLAATRRQNHLQVDPPVFHRRPIDDPGWSVFERFGIWRRFAKQFSGARHFRRKGLATDIP